MKDIINFGLVGCGRISKNHIDAISNCRIEPDLSPYVI